MKSPPECKPVAVRAAGATGPYRLDPADLAACRAALREGSRSFHTASRLLPPRIRKRATCLYAFCRLADDRVDLSDDDGRALDELRQRLDAVYAGRAWPDPADRALAAFVEASGLPRELPEALLEGFAWDAQGRQYERLSDLKAYGARVAGAVGAMMALAMGVRDPGQIARACDLGVAMQLTNIARDVGEDARAGRLYLPRAWMRQAGIDPDRWLAQPVHGPRLAGVIRRLLVAAKHLYARADPGIARLPLACRPGIAAARLVYAAIGDEIERAGADAVGRRAVVSTRRKLQLAVQACVLPLPGRGMVDAPALPETRFLVEAVAAAHIPIVSDRYAAGPQPAGRLIWAIDLFMRLEERQPLKAGGRRGSE